MMPQPTSIFRLSAVLAAGVLALTAACGEEKLAPAPLAAGPSSSSGGGSEGSGGGTVSPPEPRVRTVQTRSPWGGAVGNLLVDGDFELSVVIQGASGQAGWFSFSNDGQGYVRGETGGLCKSGMRCAIMDSGSVYFGQGTAAKGTGMVAGLWAKVPEGDDCSVIDYAIIRCNFQGSFAVSIPPVSPVPDEDGWCRYRGGVAEQTTATCAYIENSLAPGTRAILDLATLLPDDGTAPMRTMRVMGGARGKRARAIVDTIRSRRPIGDPPKREIPIGWE